MEGAALVRGPVVGVAVEPRWRRVRDWLFGDRADIDQEGLLAERTLMIAPRWSTRDDALREPAAAGSQTDEAPT